MTSPTVLLDSNVWRYFADFSSITELERCARRSGVTIQIAPSVVYEALRTGDPELRRRLIAFMVHGAWERLMPEAYEECEEIVGEVRRLRPEWLWSQPDNKTLQGFRLDWAGSSGGFWDRLRYSLDREASIVTALGNDRLDVSRRYAESLRADVRDARWESRLLNLGALTAKPGAPLLGWKGDPVAPWRLAWLHEVTLVLRDTKERHPYIDWLCPLVNVALALGSVSAWNSFWLYEADVRHMPRHWLRWAFQTLASGRKVNDGTPCDIQLATYLPIGDHFVSNDRVLCQLIEQCRPHSPVGLAAVQEVPSGRDAVAAVVDFMRTIGRRRK